jgi:hypothetical protein
MTVACTGNSPEVALCHDGGAEWLAWCTDQIRRQPLTALTLGATVGFILGGGIRSRLGRQILIISGQSLMRGAINGLMTQLLEEYERNSGRTSTGDGSGTAKGTEAGTR